MILFVQTVCQSSMKAIKGNQNKNLLCLLICFSTYNNPHLDLYIQYDLYNTTAIVQSKMRSRVEASGLFRLYSNPFGFQ